MSFSLAAYILLFAGFGLVYVGWPQTWIIADYGYLALNVGLVITCLALTIAARSWPGGTWQRSTWTGLSIGFWMWLGAAIMEIVDQVLRNPTYASKADFLWVAGYIPMYLGMYARFRESMVPRRSLAPLLLLLSACYGAVFYFYLIPRIVDPTLETPAKALDVVYASLNFVLLGMILAITRGFPARQGPHRTAFREMVAGTVLMTVADILLGYFSDRNSVMYQLLDLPYYVVYFLFYLAGVSAHRSRQRTGVDAASRS